MARKQREYRGRRRQVVVVTDKPGLKFRCDCGKLAYATRADARAAARSLHQGVRTRCYECGEAGSGSWHVTTSTDAGRTALYREHRAARGGTKGSLQWET